MDADMVIEQSNQPIASQTSSNFSIDPIPASVLADKESRRRDFAKALGACTTGCNAIDDYVLLGGFERGSIVGISAEDEEMGTKLGLQTLAHSLCNASVTRALIVTPKPANVMLKALRDGFQAQLTEEKSTARLRDCLDKVMLSCVFDLDGLWEVLADLDRSLSNQGQAEDLHRANDRGSEGAVEVKTLNQQLDNEPVEVQEIDDSQDDDDDLLSSVSQTMKQQPQPEPQQPSPLASHLPEIILITHLSSLLTGLFTHREKSAAHSALQLLGSQLRYLSRTLPSNPLILLLNSTSLPAPPKPAATELKKQQPLDPTLRSIFNLVPPPGYASHARRTKPNFGLVFTQLLDLHLLCTRLPRTRHDAELVVRRQAPAEGVRMVWVVEVLFDELGLWEGRRGRRKDREQRWAAVDVRNDRVDCAFEKET